jgi:hypothetical protein
MRGTAEMPALDVVTRSAGKQCPEEAAHVLGPYLLRNRREAADVIKSRLPTTLPIPRSPAGAGDRENQTRTGETSTMTEPICPDQALKRGADELTNRPERRLRHRSRALRKARQRYAEFCDYLNRVIDRAYRIRHE